jgi:hypothetical protein
MDIQETPQCRPISTGSAPWTPPRGGGMPCVVGGAVTVVWRVVVVVASGELAQDTSVKTKTERAEPSMIALFIT